MSTPINDRFQEPNTDLERSLEALANDEANDVQAAGFTRPSDFELEAMDGFRIQRNEAKATELHTGKGPASPGTPSRFWPIWGLSAVAGIMICFGAYKLQTATSLPGESAQGMGAALGDKLDPAEMNASERIKLTITPGGIMWFELAYPVPADGFLELRLLLPNGEAFAISDELEEPKWRYDYVKNGPLPSSYRVEITTWQNSIDGPEELGTAVLSESFFSAQTTQPKAPD